MKANQFSIILILFAAIGLTPLECDQDAFIFSDESPKLFAVLEDSKPRHFTSCQLVAHTSIVPSSKARLLEKYSPPTSVSEVVLLTTLRC